MGGDRGWRRALHRWQPPVPHHPAQHRPADPAVQQPRLRPHQGPVLADLPARHEEQVDAAGLHRPSGRSDPLRPRRRRDLRGAHGGRGCEASAGDAASRPRPQGHGVRRDPAELSGLQRRGVERGRGQEEPRRSHPRAASRASPSSTGRARSDSGIRFEHGRPQVVPLPPGADPVAAGVTVHDERTRLPGLRLSAGHPRPPAVPDPDRRAPLRRAADLRGAAAGPGGRGAAAARPRRSAPRC